MPACDAALAILLRTARPRPPGAFLAEKSWLEKRWSKFDFWEQNINFFTNKLTRWSRSSTSVVLSFLCGSGDVPPMRCGDGHTALKGFGSSRQRILTPDAVAFPFGAQRLGAAPQYCGESTECTSSRSPPSLSGGRSAETDRACALELLFAGRHGRYVIGSSLRFGCLGCDRVVAGCNPACTRADAARPSCADHDQEEEEWWPQQEGAWPHPGSEVHQLRALRPEGQGHQALPGAEPRRGWLAA